MGLMADEAPSPVGSVEFSVLTETPFGSEVRVVGTSGLLGAWCPEDGLPLVTSTEAYPKWSAKVPFTEESLLEPCLEYKFVVIGPDGSVTWEDGDNRQFRPGAADARLPTPWFGEPPPPCEDEEVVFEAMCPDTQPGDIVLVVGSLPALGGWETAAALRLTTAPDQFPWWYGEVPVPSNLLPFSWKLAILRADGTVTWEPVDNRTAVPPHGGAARWSMRVHYGGFGAAPVPCPPAPKGPPKRFNRQTAALKTSDSLPELRSLSAPSVTSPPAGSPVSDSGAPPSWPSNIEEQLILLGIADVHGTDARGKEELDVAVVFEVDESQRYPMRWDPHREAWSLRYFETGLSPAMHTFYFLIDGTERVLSSLHPVLQGSPVNVALLSDFLYRYLAARAANPEAIQDREEEAGPTRLLASTRNTIQSWSHAGSGGKAMEEEDLNWEASQKPVTFSLKTLEGLYDSHLRLWLAGHAVPAGLPPPSRLWAGARRLKKACSPACEDACFFREHALGVADGVGGMSTFASEGVDAAAYALELLQHCDNWLMANPATLEGEASIVENPEARAVGAIRAAELAAQGYGASTLVLAVLEGSTLGIANLGDSGFMVLRKRPNGMTIVAQSVDQQHAYNTPYQLMRLPRDLVTRRRLCIRHIDTAADAQTYRFGLRAGDLVLLFSDGLRDNLHDREILHIVDRALPPTLANLVGQPQLATPPELVAKALASAAKVRSVDPGAQVPFVEYSRMHGQMTQGGKADDITVVAAWAMP